MKLYEFIGQKISDQMAVTRYSTLYKGNYVAIEFEMPKDQISFEKFYNEKFRGRLLKKKDSIDMRLGGIHFERKKMIWIIWLPKRLPIHYYHHLFRNLMRSVNGLNNLSMQVNITGLILKDLTAVLDLYRKKVEEQKKH